MLYFYLLPALLRRFLLPGGVGGAHTVPCQHSQSFSRGWEEGGLPALPTGLLVQSRLGGEH